MKILFKLSNTGGKEPTIGNSNFREHYATINSNMSWKALLPTIEKVTSTVLIPLISQEMYDDIATKYEDNEGSLTYSQKLFLSECQDVIAYWTVLSAAPELNVGIGDMGIVEKGSNQAPVSPTAQWRYKEFKFELTKKADAALDSLVALLEKFILDSFILGSISYFDIYRDSGSYTQNRTSFFLSAKQFNRYVRISNSRRLFDELIIDINNAEEDIDKIICEDQFNLLAEHVNDGSLTDEEKDLVEKIRRYVAAKAVSRCTPRLFVTMDVQGLSLSSYTDGFSSFNHHSTTMRGAEAVSAYIITLQSDADMYFKELVSFIYDHIDDYPLISASACYKSYTSACRIPICTGPGGVML